MTENHLRTELSYGPPGGLPVHWQVTAAKRWITVQSGDMISSSDETEAGYPIIGGNGVRAYTDRTNTIRNTLVIGRVGARCGCVHHIIEDFWASEHAYRVIEKKPLSKRFFFHLLTALDLNRFAIKTAQPLLNTDIVERQLIGVPPVPEQTAIAAFLDRETAKIDALVEEQKRLIELLKEKRQAVISHAVTKGLNPDAPMKDTGIEWLGEVPEHWEIGPLKRWAVVQTGVAKGKDLSDVETVSVPYLRVANVQDGYIDLTEVANIDIAENALERYRLQAGDVLMNEGGDFDKLGRGHIWSGEIDPCVHQNHVFAVRPHSVTPEWLSWFSSSSAAQYYFMLRAKQSTNLASISSSNLMELPVPKPPDGEQAKIVSWIGLRVGELNKLRMLAQRSIELLNERREGLISAAVTGRIDVRGRSEEHEVAA